MHRRPPASLAYGVVAAVLWAACHLAVHLPRGWPFQVQGEWEILLVSLSAAAGELMPLPAGAIHGTEPGAYLAALVAAPLIALGVEPVLAGKWVALGFGSAFAAVCATWTYTLVAARHGAAPARGAALTLGALLACAWPGLHFDFAGLSGRTPESLFFQVLALMLALSGPSRHPRAVALLCGMSLAIAALFSPVAIWTALLVAVLVVLPASLGTQLPGGSLRFAGFALLGAFLPCVSLGLLLPDGFVGLKMFFVETLGPSALAISTGLVREHGDVAAVGRPGPLYLLARVSRALEGGAHNDLLLVRPKALAVLAWSSLGAVLWTLWKARDVQQRSFRLVAALSLSWLLPLSLLPLDRAFYPLAYRYWSIPLVLGLVLLATLAAAPVASSRSGWRRWGLLALLLVVGLSPLPSLGRSIVAPAPSLAQVAVSTGAHATAPRHGYDRHYAFTHLRRHAPEPLLAQLSEGYGLALGADAAVSTTRGEPGHPVWHELREELPSDSWNALLLGVGCGAAVFPSEPGALIEILLSGPVEEDQVIGRGLSLCSEGVGSDLAESGEPALEPGELNFSVAQPWSLLPHRF